MSAGSWDFAAGGEWREGLVGGGKWRGKGGSWGNSALVVGGIDSLASHP